MDKHRIDIFEKLFEAHYHELYIHALSFVREEEDAKDIVMDAYEYLWSHFQQIDLSGSLRPLLYTFVANRSVDFLRHEKSKKRYLKHKEMSIYTEEDYQEYEELIQKVMTLIDELPPQTARVFKECFIERKKYKEVSEMLHVSVNTIKWHITEALNKLREELSKEDLLLFFILFKK